MTTTTTTVGFREFYWLSEARPGDTIVIQTMYGTNDAPQVLAGTARTVTTWEPFSSWHTVEFTTPLIDHITRFPVGPGSVYQFVRAFRTEEPTP